MPRVRRGDAITDVIKLGDHRLIARSFIETKAYEHEQWSEFVNLARNLLISVPEFSWDDAWLRDLHLFNVVVRDAAQCLQYLDGTSVSVDLAEFYRALVEKQQRSLTALLSSYAVQDAAACLRLAEVCHLDPATDFGNIVIKSCDQPPFLALAQEQALAEDQSGSQWRSLLAEAALRSPVVAESLHRIPRSELLARKEELVPRSRRWSSGFFIFFYTQLVTFSVVSIVDVCYCLFIF